MPEPKTETLDLITKSVEDQIKTTIPSKTETSKKMLPSIRRLASSRHALAVMISIASGAAASVGSFYLLGIGKDTSAIIFVTIAVGGIAAYLNYIRKP